VIFKTLFSFSPLLFSRGLHLALSRNILLWNFVAILCCFYPSPTLSEMGFFSLTGKGRFFSPGLFPFPGPALPPFYSPCSRLNKVTSSLDVHVQSLRNVFVYQAVFTWHSLSGCFFFPFFFRLLKVAALSPIPYDRVWTRRNESTLCTFTSPPLGDHGDPPPFPQPIHSPSQTLSFLLIQRKIMLDRQAPPPIEQYLTRVDAVVGFAFSRL